MRDLDGPALDRWITGNYGEDQLPDERPDEPTAVCPGCNESIEASLIHDGRCATCWDRDLPDPDERWLTPAKVLEADPSMGRAPEDNCGARRTGGYRCEGTFQEAAEPGWLRCLLCHTEYVNTDEIEETT